MSRWYWGAVFCAVCCAATWFLPEYVREDGLGGVYGRDVGVGWNWRDDDGNPLHDAVGNKIKPNRVRTAALVVFGATAAALAGAGLAFRGKARVREVRSCEEHFPGDRGA